MKKDISLSCRLWSVEENVICIHFVCSSSETASSLLAIHIFNTPVTSSGTFCVCLIPFQRTHPVSKRAPSRVGGYGYLPIPKTRRVGTFWVYPHPVPTHFSGTSGWVPRWVHNPGVKSICIILCASSVNYHSKAHKKRETAVSQT